MTGSSITITAIFVAFLVALAIWVVLIHNGIIRRKNNLVRSWSDVIAFQRQKMKVLPQLERLADEFKKHERDLIGEVTRLRAAIDRLDPGSPDTGGLAEVERRTQQVLGGFNAVAEAYPNLTSTEVLRDLIAELTELEEHVTAAIAIFNRNIAEFNSGLQVFPNSLVNAMFLHEEPRAPFSDSDAERGIEHRFKP